MEKEASEELQARVYRLEDQSAITRLILSYGPAADAGSHPLLGGSGQRMVSTTGMQRGSRIKGGLRSTPCCGARGIRG